MPPEGLHPSRAPQPSRLLRTRVWGAGRLLVVAALLTMTFGAFFLTGMRIANRAREVAVPDLRGQSVADATRALSRAGLVLKVDQRRGDPKIPADHVLAQDPEPGTVLRRQRAIRVRVSDGLRAPEVPLLVGQALRTAEIVLDGDRIGIDTRASVRTAAHPTGVVMAQDPPAGGRSAQVSLLVNEGEPAASYVMPDVIGTTAGRVVEILRRQGFRVTVGNDVPYPGVPPGIVVRQSPQAGYQVDAGAPIVLEVSR